MQETRVLCIYQYYTTHVQLSYVLRIHMIEGYDKYINGELSPVSRDLHHKSTKILWIQKELPS